MPARSVSRNHKPWNKGLHFWSIRVRLEIARSQRDLAIFDLAIDNKPSTSKLIKLRLDDICSEQIYGIEQPSPKSLR